MDAEYWNQRYDQPELVWSAGPNVWVEQVSSGLHPATALDLGAGEGRNALWLAEMAGMSPRSTSPASPSRGPASLARERLGDAADRRFHGRVRRPTQLQADDRIQRSGHAHLLTDAARPTAQGHQTAASAVRAGGLLLVVAHDSENLAHGYGGPQDPSVLYTTDDITADLADVGASDRPGRTSRPCRHDRCRAAAGTRCSRRRVPASSNLTRSPQHRPQERQQHHVSPYHL